MDAMRFLALSTAALSVALFACDEVIRAPVTPPIEESLLDQLNAEGLTEFVRLAEVAGLTESLMGTTSQLTVLAPTNAALMALPAEVKDDPAAIGTILRFHILPGRVSSK